MHTSPRAFGWGVGWLGRSNCGGGGPWLRLQSLMGAIRADKILNLRTRTSTDMIRYVVLCRHFEGGAGMAWREEEVAAAAAAQEAAARSAASAVRVIAGPGTGKSHAIRERARWLIEDQDTRTDRIKVVSFTRASSADLRVGVHGALGALGVPNAQSVQVGTLHSLAFGALRRANMLTMYPVPPSVSTSGSREISSTKSLHVGPPGEQPAGQRRYESRTRRFGRQANRTRRTTEHPLVRLPRPNGRCSHGSIAVELRPIRTCCLARWFRSVWSNHRPGI